MMVGTFLASAAAAQAIGLVKAAVSEDNQGNYQAAFEAYMNALDVFQLAMKYEKNPGLKQSIKEKARQRRAGRIRGSRAPRRNSGGESATHWW